MSKIEELQTKIDELQKELDELKKQEKGGRWRPEVGETYYFIDTNGSVAKTTNQGTCIDEDTIALGNKFNTKERCEFVAEKLKVMEELRQFAEPEDREWDGKNRHWNIGYDYQEGGISVDWWVTNKINVIYFESGGKAKQAIDAAGEDRIKKYYLEAE